MSVFCPPLAINQSRHTVWGGEHVPQVPQWHDASDDACWSTGCGKYYFFPSSHKFDIWREQNSQNKRMTSQEVIVHLILFTENASQTVVTSCLTPHPTQYT